MVEKESYLDIYFFLKSLILLATIDIIQYLLFLPWQTHVSQLSLGLIHEVFILSFRGFMC